MHACVYMCIYHKHIYVYAYAEIINYFVLLVLKYYKIILNICGFLGLFLSLSIMFISHQCLVFYCVNILQAETQKGLVRGHHGGRGLTS